MAGDSGDHHPCSGRARRGLVDRLAVRQRAAVNGLPKGGHNGRDQAQKSSMFHVGSSVSLRNSIIRAKA